MMHFTTARRVVALVATAVFAGGFAQAAEESREPLAQPPNIVIIFIDDMGYGDIGPFGNTFNQTPNLDRMAREGLKLTQFYVSNTACTPSRSPLMTGSLLFRGRPEFVGPMWIPLQSTELPEDESCYDSIGSPSSTCRAAIPHLGGALSCIVPRFPSC
jgi:hypothetical protein